MRGVRCQQQLGGAFSGGSRRGDLLWACVVFSIRELGMRNVIGGLLKFFDFQVFLEVFWCGMWGLVVFEWWCDAVAMVGM